MSMDTEERIAESAPLSSRHAWGLLVLIVVLWGISWPVMKYGLHYVPPLTFGALRMTLGTMIISVAAAACGQWRVPLREDWPLVLAVGLLQMAAFTGLVQIGLQYVPAGRSSILAYTTPLWVLPLAVWRLREPLTRLRLLGVTVGLTGVLVLFNPFHFDWGDIHVVFGNGALLLAALLWALMIVKVRGYRWRSSPLALAPWQMGIAALALWPLAYVFEDFGQIRWGGPLVLVLLYNGPVTTAFCFWAMINVTRSLPAITTSLASLGVPLIGSLLSLVMLGEVPTPSEVFGFALILLGVVSATLDDALRHRAQIRS
jgi:drug/metabolite transporter (DMT)-like permease